MIAAASEMSDRSSAQQGIETGSNDTGKGAAKKKEKANKTEKTRRSWSTKEEEVLIALLKELVAQGWKSDNGFRAGYLLKLEDGLKKKFPGTDLRAEPHIHSKIGGWKKSYYSLTAILSQSGVGFNLNGDHMIDCDDEKWEQIIKADSNARLMRFKDWPLLDDWKEVFGKDRATGENAEDIMEAVNVLQHDNNIAEAATDDDYHVNLEDVFENDAADDSVCQSKKDEVVMRQARKKRKVMDGLEGVYELLGEISRNTDARLGKIASRIGYECDLGKARKEVFEQLGNIPGLTLTDKFDVCEILADKVERLEIFMGMPEDARPQYVMRLLQSKAT